MSAVEISFKTIPQLHNTTHLFKIVGLCYQETGGDNPRHDPAPVELHARLRLQGSPGAAIFRAIVAKSTAKNPLLALTVSMRSLVVLFPATLVKLNITLFIAFVNFKNRFYRVKPATDIT